MIPLAQILQVMKRNLKRVCPAWVILLPTIALASRQPHGPLSDTNFFPVAVWLQEPGNAARFKAAGVNAYVALWLGPTEAQLAALKAAGMPVICAQNKIALAHKDDPIILGWMHNDEPDNAQPLSIGIGHGPPVRTETVVQDYQKMRAADPSRPVLLNLGQGAAWDNYVGRGIRRNHPEDYPAYLRGCDIASFDIYPVVHEHPEVSGKLEYVANGVERLVGWTGGSKPVWSCIECTHINNAKAKATPEQVRTEVWMALIHGAKGLIYFVHEFKPKFKEAALLDDPPMLAAITAINTRIRELAPVLNSSNITAGVSVKSSVPQMPVAFMAKRSGDVTYLFTVGMRNGSTRASFELKGLPAEATAEVLDESRTIPVHNGQFEDEFKPYAAHLYRIR
jgi:hypothetical protein